VPSPFTDVAKDTPALKEYISMFRAKNSRFLFSFLILSQLVVFQGVKGKHFFHRRGIVLKKYYFATRLHVLF